MEDPQFEKAQAFWDGVSMRGKANCFDGHAVLRFFDHTTLLEVAEGKPVKFDVEKIKN